MKTLFTYWKEPDGMYLGYLNDFPDHWTQGTDFDDLRAHLLDLHKDFSKEDLPGIKRVAELDFLSGSVAGEYGITPGA